MLAGSLVEPGVGRLGWWGEVASGGREGGREREGKGEGTEKE